MKYSFQAQADAQRTVGFNNIPVESKSRYENGLEHDTGSGIIITDDASTETGGFLGANADEGVIVWGFGVRGNALGPVATATKGAFLYLINGVIYYHKFTGVSIGATINLVSTRVGEIQAM